VVRGDPTHHTPNTTHAHFRVCVYLYCLLELNMLCDCVTRGYGAHSPLTTVCVCASVVVSGENMVNIIIIRYNTLPCVCISILFIGIKYYGAHSPLTTVCVCVHPPSRRCVCVHPPSRRCVCVHQSWSAASTYKPSWRELKKMERQTRLAKSLPVQSFPRVSQVCVCVCVKERESVCVSVSV